MFVGVRASHPNLRFAVIPLVVRLGGPIFVVHALLHITMKGGIRPLGSGLDIAVFHRVVMDVVQMGGKISFIADQVFPEAALPDGPLAFADSSAGMQRENPALIKAQRLE